jgi:chromosomal replication initiation ATPase DnaA
MTLLEARRVDTRPTLFAARRPPAQWPLELPDLRSRLTACTRATIHEPDEAMLKALLHRGLQARGLTPSTPALDFAAARMERSYAAARHLIECLDRHALAHGRKVTRALVQDVMAGESI